MNEEEAEEHKCPGCYDSFSGPWCDNCGMWPCTCLYTTESEESK